MNSEVMQSDFQTVQRARYAQQVQRAAELQERLRATSIRFGQRIRNLRLALGWTQRKTAMHLGVSVRTVIRHEQNRTRRPWTPLLVRLRVLESAYGGEVLSYLQKT